MSIHSSILLILTYGNSLVSSLSSCVICLPLLHRELVKRQREVISSETALEQKRLGRHNLLLEIGRAHV